MTQMAVRDGYSQNRKQGLPAPQQPVATRREGDGWSICIAFGVDCQGCSYQEEVAMTSAPKSASTSWPLTPELLWPVYPSTLPQTTP